jgi:hypothetical protein
MSIGLRAEAPYIAASIWDDEYSVASAIEDAKVPLWLAEGLAYLLTQNLLPDCRLKRDLIDVVNEYAKERT